jgi:hypothetical protein
MASHTFLWPSVLTVSLAVPFPISADSSPYYYLPRRETAATLFVSPSFYFFSLMFVAFLVFLYSSWLNIQNQSISIALPVLITFLTVYFSQSKTLARYGMVRKEKRQKPQKELAEEDPAQPPAKLTLL